jgi:exopolysaccharide biosynthesis protein
MNENDFGVEATRKLARVTQCMRRTLREVGRNDDSLDLNHGGGPFGATRCDGRAIDPEMVHDADRSRVPLTQRWMVFTLALAVVPRSTDAVDRWLPIARGVDYITRVVRFSGVQTTAHVARVNLCDPGVELRATAPGEGRATVSNWGRRVGAVVAVNGDYFDMSAFAPLGPARGAGIAWPEGARIHHDALFAAAPGGRVSVVDASDTEAPALWRDVALRVPADFTELVAVRERVLVQGEVRESPAIVHHGGRHPRTALGLSRDRRTLWFVVIDGRSENDGGVTHRELGLFLRSLGAWDGMKLDGGGSSSMFLRRRGTVNRPSDGYPRAVATHIGVLRREVPLGTPSRCPTP